MKKSITFLTVFSTIVYIVGADIFLRLETCSRYIYHTMGAQYGRITETEK